MLQMIGESGTGKTFFLPLLGRLIVGTTFDVHTLPDDKNQFENVLINNSLAFFDNVDDVPKPLRSLFCAACTGFQIVRRVYYTTAEQMLVSSRRLSGFGPRARACDQRTNEPLDGVPPSRAAER